MVYRGVAISWEEQPHENAGWSAQLRWHVLPARASLVRRYLCERPCNDSPGRRTAGRRIRRLLGSLLRDSIRTGKAYRDTGRCYR
jgi:hypothetical protein